MDARRLAHIAHTYGRTCREAQLVDTRYRRERVREKTERKKGTEQKRSNEQQQQQ